MAAESLPDLDLAAIELLRLERQKRDLAHVLGVIADRHECFPNGVTEQRLMEMRGTHAALRRRILQLQALLLPVHGSPA